MADLNPYLCEIANIREQCSWAHKDKKKGTKKAIKITKSLVEKVKLSDALTPISVFRPRRWRGALIQHSAHVRIEVLEPEKRPVSAVADSTEVREVVEVEISEDREIAAQVLFEAGQSLSERNLAEQFRF